MKGAISFAFEIAPFNNYYSLIAAAEDDTK